jgi:hypothetical protein
MSSSSCPGRPVLARKPGATNERTLVETNPAGRRCLWASAGRLATAAGPQPTEWAGGRRAGAQRTKAKHSSLTSATAGRLLAIASSFSGRAKASQVHWPAGARGKREIWIIQRQWPAAARRSWPRSQGRHDPPAGSISHICLLSGQLAGADRPAWRAPQRRARRRRNDARWLPRDDRRTLFLLGGQFWRPKADRNNCRRRHKLARRWSALIGTV